MAINLVLTNSFSWIWLNKRKPVFSDMQRSRGETFHMGRKYPWKGTWLQLLFQMLCKILMECIHLFADKYLKILPKPRAQTNNSHICLKYANHKANTGFFFICLLVQWETNQHSITVFTVGCRRQPRAARCWIWGNSYLSLSPVYWLNMSPEGRPGAFGQRLQYTGPSFSLCWLLQLCNRSHVSTFVHALVSRALSGNDHGGMDLSLLISLVMLRGWTMWNGTRRLPPPSPNCIQIPRFTLLHPSALLI